MDSAAHLGTRLRKQRLHAEMTVGMLAELLDIDAALIDKIENGKVQPDDALVRSLAQALRCEVGELTGPTRQSAHRPKDPWLAFFDLADDVGDRQDPSE